MSKVLFSMLPAEYYLERTKIMQVRDYNQPMVIENSEQNYYWYEVKKSHLERNEEMTWNILTYLWLKFFLNYINAISVTVEDSAQMYRLTVLLKFVYLA